ncbi:MAG: selenocysteine-specific translation elongation factor [Gemmatimonadota bacterium]|nr:selenocysteine-specific translation elongation factor [Gemmatimonadota bacterium]MDE2873375.1 selenocysteine-specific translation elongation factor [Gemmatimonadota bacterium]
MTPNPKNPAGTSLILGTAGHIDHGKTSLVRALTGIDTDRLAEEKRRGITIELGFARYAPAPGVSFGIVDVPGHEGFVRTMVAGATGMDIVLLVVAADESVMPQTREHLAIVKLLGVAAIVVAITKVDLVEAEWLELVTEEVQDLLAGTPYEDSGIVPVSVRSGAGLSALAEALSGAAGLARERALDDLARLPVDRVFAMEGAGTVVTGTLWSGRMERGSTVRILPQGEEARIRAVQVHGAQVDGAVAGQRTALALTGAAVRRRMVSRGDVLVTDRSWSPSLMLTVELHVLADSGWCLQAGQRVRVHLGTVEVMSRVALFGAEQIRPGGGALAQFRLEAPVVARCGDLFVLRSYSPVTTIAGGTVLEPVPPKRKRISELERTALEELSRGGIRAVRGAVALAGWQGLHQRDLGVCAGWTGGATDVLDGEFRRVAGLLFDTRIVVEGEGRILATVRGHHRRHWLEAGAPLSDLRSALPSRAHPALANGLVARLAGRDRLVIEETVARLPGFRAALSPDEEELARRLAGILGKADLEGLTTDELRDRLSGHPRTGAVVAFLAARGEVRLLADTFWVTTAALNRAAGRVVEVLGGQAGLGPADFRKVLPVTRKHLIPILRYLDGAGVTTRLETGRRVSSTVP